MNRRRFFQTSIAAAVATSFAGRAAAWQALAAISDDIKAVTLDRKDTVIEKAAVIELRDALRGRLLLPGNEGYDTARHVLNASIDKYPALVVQPSGVADIQNAVTFARERDLLLAVKCGGHSWSGKSSCDGGLQIDLSHFRNVRVDPRRRRAYAAGGSLLGELDHESMAHGLVTTAGTVSHTGIGGLTLGGGYGRVARRFGLALDNVRSVDIVTADGQLRHASADENEDLYWGVRGGGGNFGVVTNFEFELHPMQRMITGGEYIFPLSKVKDILSFYTDYSATAPDNLYLDFAMMQPPGQDGVAMLMVCHSGTEKEAQTDLAPIAKLGTPLQNTVRRLDYVAMQRAYDYSDPRSTGSYMKSGFIDGGSDALNSAIANGFEGHPGRMTMLFFQVAGGAIGRVPTDATAFPHRYASHSLFTSSDWPAGTDGREHMNYTRAYWKTLEPFTHGYYTNETADEGQQVINSNYQGNFARLVTVKKRYDPGNLFRLNANIPTSV
jgi:FAD binding domain/Berberine and berberine like